MKISELRKLLECLAAGLNGVRAKDHSAAIATFSEGLKPFSKRDVADLESLKLRLSAQDEQGPRLRELAESFASFEAFISKTARPAVREAFNTLRIFVNDRQDMTIRSFLDALHDAFSPDCLQTGNGTTLVDAYVNALQSSKHDDKVFPRLFEQLTSDGRLSKDDVVDIANRFAFKMARSTTKKVALERIWKMHNASETFAAKSRAMKGKSAA